MEHDNIIFNEISISIENKNYIEESFRLIFAISPSDSIVTLTFSKEDEKVWGRLLIISEVITFDVRSQGDSIKVVMDLLNGKINDEIKEWKNNRFGNLTVV